MPKHVDRPSKKEAWEDIHRIADRAEPSAIAVFLLAVQNIKNGLPMKRVRDAIAGNKISVAFDLLNEAFAKGSRQLRQQLSELQKSILTSSGRATALNLSITPKISFDVTHPRIAAWIQSEGLEFLNIVDRNTKAAVNQILARTFAEGVAPGVAARRLRAVVGLSPRDVKAVENYRKFLTRLAGRESLEGIGKTTLARVKRAALSAGELNRITRAGLTEARIEKLTNLYADRLLAERATNIARTGLMDAAAAGQQESWKQALDNELIDSVNWKVFWIVTPDDRLCPRCNQLRGLSRDVNGAYANGVARPPLHHSCRCVEELRRVAKAAPLAA